MKINGPPKKPTRLKVLQGTFRQDRVAANEPKPERALPQPPDHLSDEARNEWNRVAPQLYALGLLCTLDRACLAGYCEAWSDWVDATRQCAATKDGKDRKVMMTPGGAVIENPYFSIKKRSMELMHKFLTEFGMSPASRARAEAAPPDGDDPPSRWNGFPAS